MEYKSKQKNYQSCLTVFIWLLSIATSLIIWYYIGYYSYKAYRMIHDDKKIEFRYNPTLSK
jgi:hypothetical protein